MRKSCDEKYRAAVSKYLTIAKVLRIIKEVDSCDDLAAAAAIFDAKSLLRPGAKLSILDSAREFMKEYRSTNVTEAAAVNKLY